MTEITLVDVQAREGFADNTLTFTREEAKGTFFVDYMRGEKFSSASRGDFWLSVEEAERLVEFLTADKKSEGFSPEKDRVVGGTGSDPADYGYTYSASKADRTILIPDGFDVEPGSVIRIVKR